VTTTVAKTTITVELPEAFDQRWNRLPGITVDGKRITIDPETYFFRFETSSWLVIDWETVKSDLLQAEVRGCAQPGQPGHTERPNHRPHRDRGR
jgi:hypothetical protein